MTKDKRIRRLSPSPVSIGLVWLAALISAAAAATVLLGAGLVLLLGLMGLVAGQFWIFEVLVSAALLTVAGIALLRALQAAGARFRRAGPR
jgi:hypothetical protein